MIMTSECVYVRVCACMHATHSVTGESNFVESVFYFNF